MGINTATKNLKEEIIRIINESHLPPVNILLVLEWALNEIGKSYVEILEKESIEMQEN